MQPPTPAAQTICNRESVLPTNAACKEKRCRSLRHEVAGGLGASLHFPCPVAPGGYGGCKSKLSIINQLGQTTSRPGKCNARWKKTKRPARGVRPRDQESFVCAVCTQHGPIAVAHGHGCVHGDDLQFCTLYPTRIVACLVASATARLPAQYMAYVWPCNLGGPQAWIAAEHHNVRVCETATLSAQPQHFQRWLRHTGNSGTCNDVSLQVPSSCC